MQSSLDPVAARGRDSAPRRDTDADHAAHLHALIALRIYRGYVTPGEIADALPDDAAERTSVFAAASFSSTGGGAANARVPAASAAHRPAAWTKKVLRLEEIIALS